MCINWVDESLEAIRDKVEAEIKRLNDELAAALESEQNARDILAGKTTLYELSVKNGAITAAMGTELARLMAAQFRALLDGAGAENYVECEVNFVPRDDSSEDAVTVTIQRATKPTPHQLRKLAEAERDGLKVDLAAAKTEMERLKEACAKEFADAQKWSDEVCKLRTELVQRGAELTYERQVAKAAKAENERLRSALKLVQESDMRGEQGLR